MSPPPPTFRSRPSEIQAVRWTGGNFGELVAFAGGRVHLSSDHGHAPFELRLLAGPDGSSGWLTVPDGHWVARSVSDPSDLWPLSDERFAEVYGEPPTPSEPYGAAWWDNQITLHPPRNEDVARSMDRVRTGFQNLGHLLLAELPPGPDRTVALRALKEASMHAIGAIACNQADDDEADR